MSRCDNQKVKILYILDFLRDKSRNGTAVKATDIIAMLDAHDIHCNRKTVYADIQALQDYGYEIHSTPGKAGGYTLEEDIFQLPELKLLVDAVQSSRYLTERKSQDLIKKLYKLSSCDATAAIKGNMLVSGRVKGMNESIYYNVDAIQEAISQNRQIRFRYFDWDIHGKPKYRDKDYSASPYALVQHNENCYLQAYSPRHGVTNYRVDRMKDITICGEKREPCPELTGKALIRHFQEQFQMYSGTRTTVRLRMENGLINLVYDHFGQDIMPIPDGDSHFILTVPVAVSPMFLSWVFGLGRQAEILYPQSVIDEFQKMLADISGLYEKNSEDSNSAITVDSSPA